ncbi:MAG: DUF4417 domain-containing protein [Lachnospiraceae bacterium]|nr:DUF4417 domain-containing protein [Lachnospiraceae bacterium]
MTSVEMRANNLFSRNEFITSGKWQLPKIEKQNIDLDNIQLISYSDIRSDDNEANRSKGVHFFIDDYRFEGVYRNPERSLSRLSQYRFLLSPDYSTYSDMNYWRQLESIAHSRWVGAFWQDQGQVVIPTISWSTQESFEFCFDGIEVGSIVAIGMIGCKRSKNEFMVGYNEMLSRLDPEAIIVFGTPFPDMEGRIISVDYCESRKVVR